MTATRVRTFLTGAVVLAAVLRLVTLGEQSFWADEAATVDVLDRAAGDLLAAVRDQESTPPLFYLLAFGAAEILGLGETAVRLLPALAGIAIVPVAAAIGGRLAGPPAAVAAAFLVATNPLLVWFSQEARAYSLLALLCALSVLLLLRAAEAPERPGRLLAWGAVTGLALATHYFAVFLAAPLTVWLLLALRRNGADAVRRAATALGPLVLAGLALLPLVLDQRAADRASFIAEEPFGERAVQIPKQFLVGYDAPAEAVLTAIAALLVLVAAVALARARRDDAGVRVGPLALTALAALAIPFAFALVGDDYVITRNLLPVLVVGLAVVAAGIAALPERAGVAVLGGLVALGAGTAVAVQLADRYQREDWRAAIASIGEPADGGPRLVVAAPGSGRPAALLYLGDGARVAPDDPSAVVTVREVAIVSVAERGEDGARAAARIAGVTPLTGFVPAEAVRSGRWATRRFVASVPTAAVVGSAGSGIPGTVALIDP